VTTLTFKCEASYDGPRLTSASGVSIELVPRGVRAIRHGPSLVNRVLSDPVESGWTSLLLRRHTDSGTRSAALIGPGARSCLTTFPNCAIWTYHWEGLSAEATLWLDPGRPIWFWRLNVTNNSSAAHVIDAVYGQDLGLADEVVVRNNEAYANQYIDHEIREHPDCGWTILSRQNLAQADNRHPWIMHGCLSRAVEYATDGLQFFGTGYKHTGRPAATTAESLPGSRLQYEFAYPCLQSELQTLEPGKKASFTFFAYYEADHPEPSAASDQARIEDVLRAVSDIEGCPSPGETRLDPAVALSLFESAPLLTGESLAEEELDTLFGPNRRQVEKHEAGTLSFFCGSNNHVVTALKESMVERPHGHILRTGHQLLPDPEIMSCTTYACGGFAYQVTQVHPGRHRFLSVCRDPLNVQKSSGLRIFTKIDCHWHLLGVPSVFEMGLSDCRWIYRLPDSVANGAGAPYLTVRTWASVDDPVIGVALRVTGAGALEFLVSQNVAMGANEWTEPVEVDIDREQARVSCRSTEQSALDGNYPDAAFHIVTPNPDRVGELGDDALLFDGKLSHGSPFVVMRTRPVTAFELRLVGCLHLDAQNSDLIQRCSSPGSFADANDRSDAFWNTLLNSSRLTGSEEVARLNEVLPWFAHNALIHYTMPHGLEQYGGGAWGTRDVTQGPFELLTALGNHAPLGEVLRSVFSRQDVESGRWSQAMALSPFSDRNAGEAHGDVVFWPLQALCDYIEVTDDASILDWSLPYLNGPAEPVFEHVQRLIEHVKHQFVPGTALVRYGHGDWNDSMQPASREVAERMVSAWTVELAYQSFSRFARVCQRFGLDQLAANLSAITNAIREDFNRYLMPDGVVCGFAVFGCNGEISQYLLHPRDSATGVNYRLLPMTRGILSGIFSREQAVRHADLIQDHLLFPDGARLMDRPVAYEGGRQMHFQRAETAANFGREIGLQYVHAHLRYVQAMALLGRPDALVQGLSVVNPVGIDNTVSGASPRQGNMYFSSSDGDFRDRHEASERFCELKRGGVAVKGGWRLYSSGPGLFIGRVVADLLGLRRSFGSLVIDPVLPRDLDGLTFETKFGDMSVRFRYTVGKHSHSPSKLLLAGREISGWQPTLNPYRKGGICLSEADFLSRLTTGLNHVDVVL